MTCDASSQVFYLAECGCELIANDFSPALLEIAQIKAKELKKDITFMEGDM